jgi:hypothetical protein
MCLCLIFYLSVRGGNLSLFKHAIIATIMHLQTQSFHYVNYSNLAHLFQPRIAYHQALNISESIWTVDSLGKTT